MAAYYPPYELNPPTSDPYGVPTFPYFPPPPPMTPMTPSIVSRTCPSTKRTIFEVSDCNGSIQNFDFYCNQKFIPHKCLECMDEVRESDLYPEYAVWCKEISDYVIFVFNVVTNDIEQYVFSSEFGGLEQVHIPKLKYNPSKVNLSSGLIMVREKGMEKIAIELDEYESVRKLTFKYGQWISIPVVPVRTLMMKEIEETENVRKEKKKITTNEQYDLNSDDEEYLKRLKTYRIRYCSKFNINVIYILSRHAGYEKYVYNEKKRQLEPFDSCPECKDLITENDLIPKYAEYCDQIETYVIHTWNTETLKMEQYKYNSHTQEFEQVYFPELVYNPSRDTDASTLFTVDTEDNTVIMRDSNGKLKKEQFCSLKLNYVKLPQMPVKTFLVKWNEKAKKNKKKTSEEASETLKVKTPEQKTSETGEPSEILKNPQRFKWTNDRFSVSKSLKKDKKTKKTIDSDDGWSQTSENYEEEYNQYIEKRADEKNDTLDILAQMDSYRNDGLDYYDSSINSEEWPDFNNDYDECVEKINSLLFKNWNKESKKNVEKRINEYSDPEDSSEYEEQLFNKKHFQCFSRPTTSASQMNNKMVLKKKKNVASTFEFVSPKR